MSGALDESLVERIIGLSPQKRMALEQRMTSAVMRGSAPVPGGDVVTAPTSFGQRGQWFVNQLDRENPFFNKTDAVRIRGPLDIGALQRALSALVARHAVLRTGYAATDDGPVQVVNPPAPIELPVLDIAPGPRQSAELHRHLAAEQRRPFDLENGPMYRAGLIRLGPDDHVLTRTNHHIAFDRWSSAIANRELSVLYRAFAAGEEPNLEPLPYQYADFARWQRTRLDAASLAQHLGFAEAHLAGVPRVLDLPTDHPRLPAQSHQGASYSAPLDSGLVRKIRERARSEGATPFMICMAAFGILIGRYARSDHFLVGVPAAGRNAPGSDALIGLFINSMVMRLDLRGDPSFSELVARVRAAALGVLSHQDLPFDVLVENLAKERVAGRTPVFQVMLDYINTPGATLELGTLDLEAVPIADEASAYDVNLYLFDDGERIDAKWEYRSDLFDRPTIVRMSEAFASVLETAVDDPGRATSTIPIVPGRDRERIGALGSGPVTDVPGPGTYLQQVELQARRRPDADAVVAGDTVISYRRLWEQVIDVSRRIDASCRASALVGISVGRSAQLVSALLGVLHSGRTAVLIDPSQPTQRLSTMLDQVELDASITPGSGLDAEIEVNDRHAGSVAPTTDGDSAAYVVFTSGSTGTPRPVAIGRSALENFVADACERYAFTPEDRVLQFASPGFDTILEEVLPPLACGATLVLRPPELFASFAGFSSFVADHGLTVLDLPTAWWHAWVDDMMRTGENLVPEMVRLVIIGGEAARVDRWRVWRQVTGGTVRLVNTYGPSETTVVVATFEPSSDWTPVADVVPIGLPIRNARLSVVDTNGHVVPPGVPGELVVQGAPVGLGYLDETGQENGFEDGRDGARRYRTGDLARVGVDGIHEYLGRLDDQLKVNGIRIEPAEVEAALRGHPAVEDAVVLGFDGPGDARLVAHVVSPTSVDERAVRRHLHDLLPEAMIPGSIVTHTAFPLTTSGKIDRLALHGITDDRRSRAERQDADRLPTPTELRVARVWEAVMPHVSPGLDDDFFAVGGHSLLGVRLISHAADEFGVELPLRMIYEAPTVARMARWIDGLVDGDADTHTADREGSLDHAGA